MRISKSKTLITFDEWHFLMNLKKQENIFTFIAIFSTKPFNNFLKFISKRKILTSSQSLFNKSQVLLQEFYFERC